MRKTADLLGVGSAETDVGALTIYAMCTAPSWTLDPSVDQPIHRHSDGNPMARSELVGAPTPLAPSNAQKQLHRKLGTQWGDDEGFSSAIRPATPPAVQQALDKLGCGDAGYYLLEFENGDCYVGQSISISDRLSGHRVLRKDISGIRLLPDVAASNLANPLRHLLDREAELINSAQEAGLPARNKAQMTYMSTHRPLDEIFTANDSSVTEWLADPVGVNARCLNGQRSLTPSGEQLTSGQAAYTTWLARTGSRAPSILSLLRDYIQRCLPLALQTEYDYWVLTSPEVTPVFGTLSNLTIGWTEAFRINISKTGHISGWVQANSVELFGDDHSDRPLVRFLRQHPGVDVWAAKYQAAGPFNVNIEAPDVRSLADLLDDTAVTRAAATAALHLMRKSKTGAIRSAHNPVLVNAILGRSLSG